MSRSQQANEPASRPLPRWVAPIVLILAIVAVYQPTLDAGFIWDDQAHVTAPALRSWEGLARIWTEIGATQQYYPLLHTAFWLQHRLWRGAPLGYHLVSAGLHAAAAVLLLLVLRRLAVPGAFIAALLFAVHPVHVESVAWISEQKNTLSAVFGLSAVLAYLRFDAERSRWAYAAGALCFALGLLTKTVVAALPAALLVVLWWRRGRLSWRGDIGPLAPWLLPGAAAGLFTAWLERAVIGATGPAFDLTFAERALLAGRVVWFYFTTLIWPANLTFVYPRWTLDAGSVTQWLPLIAAISLLVVLCRLRQRSRAPLAVALLFGGLLFPVLGFLNVYPFQYSFVADHFQYLASIPILALGAAALTRLHVFTVFNPSISGPWVTAVLAAAALGTAAWRQTHDYRDSLTLFRATVARNPGASMAWNNLGKELMTAKPDLPEAIRCLERALALRPEYFEARNNLGLALTQVGRPTDAIPQLEAALQLKPSSFQTHNNLGIALAGSGRAEEAVRAFAAAAALNPTLPNIHENWAKALQLLGRTAEAEERRAVAARLREAGRP